jgi:hypothetical protein
MPLNSSGPISIGGSTSGQSINLELGRSATATSSLNESALRSLAGVSSGAISLSNFYGKSNLAATLNSYDAGAYDVYLYRTRYVGSGSAYARVGITLYSDGTARYFYEDTGTATANFTSFTWKTGAGSVGDYYARFIVDSGSSSPNSSSSATGTDLVLSTTREWKAFAEVPGTNQDAFFSVTGTLQIRNSSGTVLAAKTIFMDVAASSGTPP